MWPFKKKQPRAGTPVVAVLIDMQPDFIEGLNEDEVRVIIEAQLAVIEACKAYDIPLIVLEFWCWGTTLPELWDAVRKVPRHFRITKRKDSGFTSNQFTHTLESLRPRKLLLMGVNASYCVLSTAKGALRRGYEVVTAEDLIADGVAHASRGKEREWYRRNGTFFAGSVDPAEL